LGVTIAVSGGSGNPTPTGSVTLTSGSYASSATALSGGSAKINIPAGSLAAGSDTLTATYTPDSNSSSTYTTATGTSSAVTVTAQTSAVAGYLPLFTDAAGDLGDSALFQLNTGTTTYLGLGTSTPSFNLHFISQVDPAAITIDGYGTVGINFIGRRAEGTLAKPTALLARDNIMAMQGRGYGLTGFSSASRAYMKFFAAENWSDSAQGTYISLATTLKGTAVSVERLRILDNGRVGIGTITPTSPLTVAGAIQSTSGGFIFPDGTVQTTAAK
jgi:hypothetical protein